MARSKYTKYKDALEKMGLKQLDVYRYSDKEVVRVLRLSDGRVFVIELPKKRDEMSIDEFVKVVKEAISRKH